jgi:cephalosporin-C deacetylase-like acetyl esterase
MRTLLAAVAVAAVAADFQDIDPNVFPKDDPRAKEMPRMVRADAQRRMKEANLRESQAFAVVQTRGQWEAHRDARIQALRESLGTFPDVPKDMRVVVTRKLDGDGYRIHNLVYETRPGFWANANLYLPAKPVEKMPGLVIVHSHHTPNTQGELQDMGMTWARSGCAVLVPELLGHGERRQHDFASEKDYPKPFRVGRQDYYFRYNSNLQLSVIGDSLMGWFAWDLMRGIDVLLRQPGIDRDRIIMLGAVAGGGDPAGVTAALDSRIACVVPFNFGGWQPESRVTANPDRDFDWFGEGYWESTRGLRGGAAGGFAHYVITGSIAPRKLLYAHEFKWDPTTDPAWPRLQKIYGLYGAKQNLAFAHGAGSVRGQAGPENTHCTHIGATHRRMIYPALKEWFGMPIPEEYSKRRAAEELTCWTPEARAELKPKKLHEVLQDISNEQIAAYKQRLAPLKPTEKAERLRTEWARLLGDIEPPAGPKLITGQTAEVPGGILARFALEVEPGIVVPFVLITPNDPKGKPAVVVMVAQGGKADFLKERGDAISAFLTAGVAVCLADVRGTGETKAGASAERGSTRTSVSQTELILRRAVLGNQLRDLRTVIRWLRTRDDLDGQKLAVWGDSFARPNPADRNPAAPLDAPDLPPIAEPGGALLAGFATFFESSVGVAYTRGGLTGSRSLLESPYLDVPHEAVVPGVFTVGGYVWGGTVRGEGKVDGRNRRIGQEPVSPADAAAWVVKQLAAK